MPIGLWQSAAPDPDAELPKLPAGYHWAKPEFARKYLKNYDERVRKLVDQFNAFAPLQGQLNTLRAQAIDMQKVAKGELDRIRRNDIWPNWETLGHALTAIGTISTCLEGSCLVGLAVGAISLYHAETGVATKVATSCLPNPAHGECAQAIAEGAAHLGAHHLADEAKRERMSDKERASADLANGRLAEEHFNEELKKLEKLRAPIQDEMNFLSKAYDYALWGREEDNPLGVEI
jgi:hypothetical protein